MPLCGKGHVTFHVTPHGLSRKTLCPMNHFFSIKPLIQWTRFVSVWCLCHCPLEKLRAMGQAGSWTMDKVAFILSTLEYICSLNEYLVFMIFLADFRAWGHLWYLTPFHNDVLLVDGKQSRFYTESFIAIQPETQEKKLCNQLYGYYYLYLCRICPFSRVDINYNWLGSW